jgi:hypothetical protein
MSVLGEAEHLNAPAAHEAYEDIETLQIITDITSAGFTQA